MANMHILERTGNAYRIAAHIAVPAGNNGAAVAWSAVVVRSGAGGTTILADGDGTAGTISAAEKTSILAGTLLELVDTVDLPAGLGGAALLTWLDQWYAARVAEVQANVQARLGQYGRTR